MTTQAPSWSALAENPPKIVFIAGPVTGDGSVGGMRDNIQEAELYATALANAGIGFYCPHLNARYVLDGSVPDGRAFFPRLHLKVLQLCDGAVFLPGWESSSGSRIEWDWAGEHALTRFYPLSPDDLGEIIAWAQTA